jgi:hypothetical protein
MTQGLACLAKLKLIVLYNASAYANNEARAVDKAARAVDLARTSDQGRMMNMPDDKPPSLDCSLWAHQQRQHFRALAPGARTGLRLWCLGDLAGVFLGFRAFAGLPRLGRALLGDGVFLRGGFHGRDVHVLHERSPEILLSGTSRGIRRRSGSMTAGR